jgi:hypothetical protein
MPAGAGSAAARGRIHRSTGLLLGVALLLSVAACQGVEPTPTPADEPITLHRSASTSAGELDLTLEDIRDGPYIDPRDEDREGPHAVLSIRGHLPDGAPETVTLGEGESVQLGDQTLRLVDIVEDEGIRFRLAP